MKGGLGYVGLTACVMVCLTLLAGMPQLAYADDVSVQDVKAAKQAEKVAAKAAKQAEKAAAKAVKQAEKAEIKAAKQAEKVAAKAAKQAEKAEAKAAKQAEKAVIRAAKQAEKVAEKAAKQAEKAALKASRQAEKLARAAARKEAKNFKQDAAVAIMEDAQHVSLKDLKQSVAQRVAANDVQTLNQIAKVQAIETMVIKNVKALSPKAQQFIAQRVESSITAQDSQANDVKELTLHYIQTGHIDAPQKEIIADAVADEYLNLPEDFLAMIDSLEEGQLAALATAAGKQEMAVVDLFGEDGDGVVFTIAHRVSDETSGQKRAPDSPLHIDGDVSNRIRRSDDGGIVIEYDAAG